jgi:hypothetical protein
MNMEENAKKIDNLEKAKTIMGKIDPALLSAALSEMMIEADEAEEADVAKVKKAIKGIYDAIPEGKDKTSIVSKAITELDSEIIEKEVKVIKGKLANIDKETIMEAAKEYVGIEVITNLPYCSVCIKVSIKPACLFGCIKYDVTPPCYKCVNKVMPLCFPCIHKIMYQEDWEWPINPLIKEQLTEETIQGVLQSPELSRAIKNMFKKIQAEK